MSREQRIYCTEHESLNDPCDAFLLEVEVEGSAKPCRPVKCELRIHQLQRVDALTDTARDDA